MKDEYDAFEDAAEGIWVAVGICDTLETLNIVTGALTEGFRNDFKMRKEIKKAYDVRYEEIKCNDMLYNGEKL